MPQNESNELLFSGDSVTTTKLYESSVAEGTYGNVWVVTYRGEKKVIRRAQGLMQLTPATGKSLCEDNGITGTEAIISAIRTPYTNAMLGAQYLASGVKEAQIKNNSIINDHKSDDSWKRLSEDLKVAPETLIAYAMSHFKYASGSVPTNGMDNFIKSMKYDPTAETKVTFQCDTSVTGIEIESWVCSYIQNVWNNYVANAAS